MKNYKVLLRDDKIVTVKADKYIIERRGTLTFYKVDKYSSSGSVISTEGIRAFNNATWAEVWVDDE